MTNEKEEIKPCPFCGDVPKKYSHLNLITGEFKVRCVNFSCPIYLKAMSVSAWSARATPTLVPAKKSPSVEEIIEVLRPIHLRETDVLPKYARAIKQLIDGKE